MTGPTEIIDAPPTNDVAEVAVLGSILQDPECLELVEPILAVKDFASPSRRVVFEAMLALRDQGDPADPLLVLEHLKRANRLKLAGGPDQVMSLGQSSSSSGVAPQYARVVRDAAVARRAYYLAADIRRAALNGDDLSGYSADLDGILSAQSEEAGGHVSELMADALTDLIDRRDLSSVDEAAIGWGIHELDNIGAFIRPGDFVVFAGPPKVGKSMFVMSQAVRWANVKQAPVIIASFELTPSLVTQRIICSEAGVPDPGVHAMPKENQAKVRGAADWLSKQPIFIPNRIPADIEDFTRWARSVIRKHNPATIVVDYMGMMRADGQTRTHQLTEISSGLRSVARDTRCPIVAVQNMSRGWMSDRRPPEMRDLRESGQIEYDATHILFLYRPHDLLSEKDKKRADVDPAIIRLRMAACRYAPGPIEVPMVFDQRSSRLRPLNRRTVSS